MVSQNACFLVLNVAHQIFSFKLNSFSLHIPLHCVLVNCADGRAGGLGCSDCVLYFVGIWSLIYHD